MIWADNVRKRLNAVTMTDAGRVAARAVLPMMRTRIFDHGIATSGGAINKYSTKPIYISLENMTRTGVGQKTRDNKSRFFPGGYAEYKSAIGAKGFNLRNFGIMMKDFGTPQEIIEGTRLRFRFKQERSEMIAVRYPQAFGFTQPERDLFNEVYTFQLQKRLFRD